tara:strand:- start:866 stop:1327 length:462 start_codon:yes stop_codon:yes gene_type:complete
MVEEHEQFVDGEQSFRKDEVLTFRQVVMRQLEAIREAGNVELKAKHKAVYRSYSSGGNDDYIYEGDTREVYINRIRNLSDYLEAYFDEEMQKESKKYSEETTTKYNEGKKREEPKMTQDEWNSKNLSIKRKLLRALLSFLKRMNYFAGKQFEQ